MVNTFEQSEWYLRYIESERLRTHPKGPVLMKNGKPYKFANQIKTQEPKISIWSSDRGFSWIRRHIWTSATDDSWLKRNWIIVRDAQHRHELKLINSKEEY